nr:LysR family transcriptional regulator [Pseudoduganella rivuli]
MNDIALFVQVVRAGSFAEAARQLGIPPSTASRRLQALERAGGVRLLQRSTRRLALTDAGQAFFAQCAEQIDALSQSAQDLADSGKALTGRVRVAAGVDFLNWFPLDQVAAFMARHPGIRVEFVLADARADLLAEGIDVALRAGDMVEPALVAKQIGTVQWQLVASPDYLSSHGVPDCPGDLARHDCIAAPARSGVAQRWQLRHQGELHDVAVGGRFQVNSLQAQLNGALAGLGIALAPTLTTRQLVRQGLLHEVLPDYHWEAGVYFVYPSRRHIPRAVRTFTEFATAVLLERGLVAAPAPRR